MTDRNWLASGCESNKVPQESIWFNPSTFEWLFGDAEQHYASMKQYIEQQKHAHVSDPMRWAFENGWLKLSNSNATSITVYGTNETIVIGCPLLLDRLLVAETVNFHIYPGNHYFTYHLPRDVKELSCCDFWQIGRHVSALT